MPQKRPLLEGKGILILNLFEIDIIEPIIQFWNVNQLIVLWCKEGSLTGKSGYLSCVLNSSTSYNPDPINFA